MLNNLNHSSLETGIEWISSINKLRDSGREAFLFYKTHFKLLQRYKCGYVNNSFGHFKNNIYLVFWKVLPNSKKQHPPYSSDHKNSIIWPENWSFITYLLKTWNQLVKWNLSHTLYHVSILFLLHILRGNWISGGSDNLFKQFSLEVFLSKGVLLCKSVILEPIHSNRFNSISCCLFLDKKLHSRCNFCE